MPELYDFLTGPGLWISFAVFFGGLIIRVAFLFGLSRERDRVFYNHQEKGWAARSIGHWLLPLGSVSLRAQPVFGIVFFVFHVCLLGVPLFLDAHNILWAEFFGFSLPSLRDSLADGMTIVLFVCIGFLFLRRLARPEVRILTTPWDYSLLVLTLLPFLTGFLAYHQWGPYSLMMLLHVLTAEILLVVIPFSKLGHVVLFFFTRAFIGFEMGARRGAKTW